MDDVHAGRAVVVERQAVQLALGAEQRHAAAGHDALFRGRLGGVQGVVDARLAFFHFDFGGRADFDDGDAARQLGESLLEFFAVVVGRGLFDLGTDLIGAPDDVLLAAGPADDGRVVLVHDDPLAAAQVGELEALQLDAQLFGDDPATGQNGEIFQHGFAPVAEARRLDRRGVQRAANLVDDQGRERLAFDVLGDDDERPPALGDLFQQRHQVLHVRQFLLVQQDVRVLDFGDHPFGVRHEVRRQKAAVEAHPLDHVEHGLQALAFFDGNHAFLADLVHGVGQDGADFGVAVGGDGADLGDLVAAAYLAALLADAGDDFFHRGVDAAFEGHRVEAGGLQAQSFGQNRP